MTPPLRRLIEVAFPFSEVAAATWEEKTIRDGHPLQLHTWWARRPLVEARAIALATLVPDPAEPACPEGFREAAATCLRALQASGHLGPREVTEPMAQREALTELVARFARWEASLDPAYLEASRALVAAAHEALRGEAGRPLVFDPFAGAGSIPLEALRVGADVFASDLNPVAVLLEKVTLEYVPRFGARLATELRRAGEQIGKEAAARTRELYPLPASDIPPLAYLWARVVRCEQCGTEVPALRSLWLARRYARAIALRLVADRDAKRVDVEIVVGAAPHEVGDGTVNGGAVTCPVCAYVTGRDRVRAQLRARAGGSAGARLLCVVELDPASRMRRYRRPEPEEIDVEGTAPARLMARAHDRIGRLSFLPDEEIASEIDDEKRWVGVAAYGMVYWRDLFSPRQLLSLSTVAELVRGFSWDAEPPEFAAAVRAALALALDRAAETGSSLVTWWAQREATVPTMARIGFGMTWDFAESNPWEETHGSWARAVDQVARGLEALVGAAPRSAQVAEAAAAYHPLPEGAADVLITDPPFYNAVPYADLSDFFYPWLRRAAPEHAELLRSSHAPRAQEAVGEERSRGGRRDAAFYEHEIRRALGECLRVLRPDGIGVVVFASKSTSSWTALVCALIDAGWTLTASWPIDVERRAALRPNGRNSIDTAVYLVCRPRKNPDGSLRTDAIGYWRDVLTELPERIHDWLPHLMKEGVVGADAIIACLGPALEIFSRYSRVEDAAGDEITVEVYLGKVWEVVTREAVSQILAGVDTAGFEPDARLTVMWLWTLFGRAATAPAGEDDDEAEDEEAKPNRAPGFVLEYAAALNIAQGQGAVLEDLSGLVEVRGDTARLLSVGERGRVLFGQADEHQPAATVLDRVHQAMILFGQNRGVVLKRLLVEDGVGRDERFWRLANALNALYPTGSDERRWVEGVLTRRKALGL